MSHFGATLLDETWAPSQQPKSESELLQQITQSLVEVVWEKPLEEALSEWVMGDPKALALLQSIPALRNYRVPTETLAALKDTISITGI